ncbi:MAG: ABC transporter ATP-binding protein, partial [Colwellia sp.]|nr:ABC transporter ATP-binding protein [Colwellia sp.]
KSTLLKILSRVTGPTTGSARIKGRIASLLEVGTGFHPELTGKENIYLNGAILGMNWSEIKNKFDEIVDFSGVERYIDTPVKRYSSGMYVRLAFAVAAHLDPEILIIDEVLAVGDLEFQKKCLAKMKDVAEGGKTVFFVSHNLSAVQNLCTSAMLLEGGVMVDKGQTEDIINLYKSAGTEMAPDKVLVEIQPDLSLPIQLNKVFITNSDKVSGLSIEFLEDCYINLEFVIREQNAYYYIYLHLQDIMGNIIFIAADDDLESGYPLGDISPGTYNYLIKVPGKILKPNQYYLTVNMVERYQGTLHPNSNIVSLEIVDTKSVRASKNLYRGVAIVAPEIHWELSENKTGV